MSAASRSNLMFLRILDGHLLGVLLPGHCVRGRGRRRPSKEVTGLYFFLSSFLGDDLAERRSPRSRRAVREGEGGDAEREHERRSRRQSVTYESHLLLMGNARALWPTRLGLDRMPIRRARGHGATGTVTFQTRSSARKVAALRRLRATGDCAGTGWSPEGAPIDWNGACSLHGGGAIVARRVWSLKANSLIRSIVVCAASSRSPSGADVEVGVGDRRRLGRAASPTSRPRTGGSRTTAARCSRPSSRSASSTGSCG